MRKGLYMLDELYEIIVSVYQEMNRCFEIPREEITPLTELKELNIDSLTFIIIMLKIEEHFHVNMASEETPVFCTVQDVIDTINKKCI